MAFLSNTLAVSQPSGVWVSIIKAFEGALGNYILAIILLTVVIGVVWAVVDTFQKYNTQKMSAIQAKMQPEMDKLKAKYEKQPQVLQQKQNELQQRYMGKSQMGSCLIMMLVMALNLALFFTLFSGLNAMAAYKISSNYENLKYTYANCLNVVDKYIGDEISEEEKEIFNDYENLSFVIEGEGEEKTISLVRNVGENQIVLVDKLEYVYDFSSEEPAPPAPSTPEGEPAGQAEGEGSEQDMITISSNANIYKLITKYFPVDDEGKYDETKDVVIKTTALRNVYLSEAVQDIAMREIVETYDETKESFLWIKNIWIADSPLSKSILSYSSIESNLGKKNIGENEEQIYNAFMLNLAEERGETNGYMIIPILCILSSFLSTIITNLYNNHKNKKKGLPITKKNAKWATFIMPIIFGVFALFYNSVFAIYMLTRQVVSALILPLQLYIVDKILEKREAKNQNKTDNNNKNIVDYSRKF